MKILMLKDLDLIGFIDGEYAEINLKSKKVYDVLDHWAESILEHGYGVEFGFFNELPITIYYPDRKMEVSVEVPLL